AKVSDKIAVLEALLEQVSTLVIGGAMANTFLAAKGLNVQASKVETDKLALARTILEKAISKKVDVLLPVDVVVAGSFGAESGTVVPVSEIPAGHMALDVGPKSVELFAKAFKDAKTIFWNGPMGIFEREGFSK